MADDTLDFGPVNDPGYYYDPIDYGPINDPGYYDIPIDYSNLFGGSSFQDPSADIFGNLTDLGLDSSSSVSLNDLLGSYMLSQQGESMVPYSTFGTDIQGLMASPEWESRASSLDPQALYQLGTPEARALASDIEQKQADEQALLTAGNSMSQILGDKFGMSRAAYSEDPRGTGLFGVDSVRPAQSYVLPDGTVVGMSGDGADVQNPYDFVQLGGSILQNGNSGETYIKNNDTGRLIGYLNGDNQEEYYQQDRMENGANSEQGWLAKLGNALVNKGGQAAGNAANRALNGALGGGQAQPGTSGAQGALSAAKMAALLYQALNGKNQGSGVTARDSNVANTGPQAQRAKAVRTLYAKGGAIEVPERVGGGLLPVSLALAHHLANQKGLIPGNDGGQDDVVDIKAAPGEYIFDAETVSALGDGNTAAGAKRLDEMRENIRSHKRAGGLNQIAAKAKDPHAYLKGK